MCPREKNPRENHDDSTPFELPKTAYYRRRFADGSLVEHIVAPVTHTPGAESSVEKKKPKGVGK